MVIREFRHLLVAREVLDHGGGENEAVRALSDVEAGVCIPLSQPRPQERSRLHDGAFGIDLPPAVGDRRGGEDGRMPLDVALDLLVVEQEGSSSG